MDDRTPTRWTNKALIGKVREASDSDYQVVTLDGCFFCHVYDEIVGACIANTRTWEFGETEWVKATVRSGDIVVDAGANIGWYTVVMARAVGSSGLVLAFEPEPRNFALLTKNVGWNGFSERCLLSQVALWEEERTLKLELCGSNFGDHRVRIDAGRNDSDPGLYGESKRVEIVVPAKPLDAIISETLPEKSSIRLLKVDTQGSEVSILRGAERALERTEYLFCEYWPYGLARMGHNADDFESCLKGYFSEFCNFTVGERKFQPMEKLRDDLSVSSHTTAGESMYVFRKSGVDD